MAAGRLGGERRWAGTRHAVPWGVHSWRCGLHVGPLVAALTHPRCPPPLISRPDGQKKAYVRLTSDYDALDVANKIGVI